METWGFDQNQFRFLLLCYANFLVFNLYCLSEKSYNSLSLFLERERERERKRGVVFHICPLDIQLHCPLDPINIINLLLYARVT